MARVVCSYCKRDMGPFPGEYDSHGACVPCARAELAKAGFDQAVIDEAFPLGEREDEIGLLEIGEVDVILANDADAEAEAVREIERLGFDPAEVLL